MDNAGFYYWLRHERFTISLALLCACLPLVLQFVGSIDFPLGLLIQNNIDHIYTFCNVLFICVSLWVLTRKPSLISRETDKSYRLYKYVQRKLPDSRIAQYEQRALFRRMDLSIKQFYYSWVVIWLIWLIMYIAKFACNVTLESVGVYTLPYAHFFENTLNLLNSFTMFFIYMVITISTVSSSSEDNMKQMHMAVIILIFIGVCCVLADFYTLFFYKNYIQDYYEYQFYIKMFIGFIASISMMAVLGRLNSSYLDVPQWLIVCLYFYAAVQMLYPLIFMEDVVAGLKGAQLPDTLMGVKGFLNGMTHMLYFSAFIGKICLFLIIRWIMEKKRFLFFLIHKAHSMLEAEDMLKEFNRYYEGNGEEEIDLS